jgi:hypothetical protein
MSLRFKVNPRDVPPIAAARCLGLTLEAFYAKLDELRQRGFPAADPTTGNYDLVAIDAWQTARHPQLFTGPSLTAMPTGRNADVVLERLARIRGG